MSGASNRRRIVTTMTLLAAAAAVAVMAVWGINAATAPVAKDPSSPVAKNGPTCPVDQQQIKSYLTRPEITVSVYNTGKRKGRAGDTLTLLENAGFKAGEIGNGTAGDTVVRAEVRTTKTNDLAATLVARSMGRGTRVVVTDQAYGPGVDVFIGDKFGGLNDQAPRRIKLATAQITCK